MKVVIKVKQLLNKKDISPSCSYCLNGKLSPDREKVLCKKMGVVEKDFACRKFRYDPLKRQPRRPKTLEHFEESDFAITDDEE